MGLSQLRIFQPWILQLRRSRCLLHLLHHRPSRYLLRRQAHCLHQIRNQQILHHRPPRHLRPRLRLMLCTPPTDTPTSDTPPSPGPWSPAMSPGPSSPEAMSPGPSSPPDTESTDTPPVTDTEDTASTRQVNASCYQQ